MTVPHTTEGTGAQLQHSSIYRRALALLLCLSMAAARRGLGRAAPHWRANNNIII
jgi:hypothetical protein